MTYQSKVYRPNADQLVIASGGSLVAEAGSTVSIDEMDLANLNLGFAAIDAAGANQGNATPITTSVALVDDADGSKGVRLPAAEDGKIVMVINLVAATHALKVYPATGGKIDGGSANAASEIAAGKRAIFIGAGADWWKLSGA